MRDKYNLNTMPTSATDADDVATGDDSSQLPIIPGMAPEDRVDLPGMSAGEFSRVPPPSHITPHGNPRHHENFNDDSNRKKTPYSKPIPKSFQNSWNDISSGPPPPQPQQAPPHAVGPPPPSDNFGPPPPGCLTLQELQRQATAIVAFGNVYPVLPGSNLFMSIMNGEMAVKECLRNEFLIN